MYKFKVNGNGQAYDSQGYYFLPAIGSTRGRQDADLVRLHFPVASVQAEYIVKYLRIHEGFQILAGHCFAGMQGTTTIFCAVRMDVTNTDCAAYGPRDPGRKSPPQPPSAASLQCPHFGFWCSIFLPCDPSLLGLIDGLDQ